MTSPEEWRAVPRWPLYEVSSLGRVRRIGAAHVLKSRRSTRTEHQKVKLYDGTGHRGSKDISVHVLVMETFVGPRPTPTTEIRHLDSDPHNNEVANLAYGTRDDNLADRTAMNRDPQGERNGMAQLTAPQVLDIRKRYKGRGTKPSQYDLAKEYGVSQSAISRIILRTDWRHI